MMLSVGREEHLDFRSALDCGFGLSLCYCRTKFTFEFSQLRQNFKRDFRTHSYLLSIRSLRLSGS